MAGNHLPQAPQGSNSTSQNQNNGTNLTATAFGYQGAGWIDPDLIDPALGAGLSPPQFPQFQPPAVPAETPVPVPASIIPPITNPVSVSPVTSSFAPQPFFPQPFAPPAFSGQASTAPRFTAPPFVPSAFAVPASTVPGLAPPAFAPPAFSPPVSAQTADTSTAEGKKRTRLPTARPSTPAKRARKTAPKASGAGADDNSDNDHSPAPSATRSSARIRKRKVQAGGDDEDEDNGALVTPPRSAAKARGKKRKAPATSKDDDEEDDDDRAVKRSKLADTQTIVQGTICDFCANHPIGKEMYAANPICDWQQIVNKSGEVYNLECTNCANVRSRNRHRLEIANKLDHMCQVPGPSSNLIDFDHKKYGDADAASYTEKACNNCSRNNFDETCDVDTTLGYYCFRCRHDQCRIGKVVQPIRRPNKLHRERPWFRHSCDRCQLRQKLFGDMKGDDCCSWLLDRREWGQNRGCTRCFKDGAICLDEDNLIAPPSHEPTPASWQIREKFDLDEEVKEKKDRKKKRWHEYVEVNRRTTWRKKCVACDTAGRRNACIIKWEQSGYACERCTQFGIDCFVRHEDKSLTRYPIYDLSRVGFGHFTPYVVCKGCKENGRNCDRQRPCDSCTHNRTKCDPVSKTFVHGCVVRSKITADGSNPGPLYYLALGYGPAGVEDIKDGRHVEHWVGPIAPMYGIIDHKDAAQHYRDINALHRPHRPPVGVAPPNGNSQGTLGGKQAKEFQARELGELIAQLWKHPQVPVSHSQAYRNIWEGLRNAQNEKMKEAGIMVHLPVKPQGPRAFQGNPVLQDQEVLHLGLSLGAPQGYEFVPQDPLQPAPQDEDTQGQPEYGSPQLAQPPGQLSYGQPQQSYQPPAIPPQHLLYGANLPSPLHWGNQGPLSPLAGSQYMDSGYQSSFGGGSHQSHYPSYNDPLPPPQPAQSFANQDTADGLIGFDGSVGYGIYNTQQPTFGSDINQSYYQPAADPLFQQPAFDALQQENSYQPAPPQQPQNSFYPQLLDQWDQQGNNGQLTFPTAQPPQHLANHDYGEPVDITTMNEDELRKFFGVENRSAVDDRQRWPNTRTSRTSKKPAREGTALAIRAPEDANAKKAFNPFLGFTLDPEQKPRFKPNHTSSRWKVFNPLEGLDMDEWRSTQNQSDKKDSQPRLFSVVNGQNNQLVPWQDVLGDVPYKKRGERTDHCCAEPGEGGFGYCGSRNSHERDQATCQSLAHRNTAPGYFPVCGECVQGNAKDLFRLNHNPITESELLSMRAYLCNDCAGHMSSSAHNAAQYSVIGARRIYGIVADSNHSQTIFRPDDNPAHIVEFQNDTEAFTGCSCANRMLGTSLCRFHRLYYAEEALKHSAMIQEWRLSHFKKAVCPSCLAQKPLEQVKLSADFSGFVSGAPTAWACVNCNDWVANERNDESNQPRIIEKVLWNLNIGRELLGPRQEMALGRVHEVEDVEMMDG
ncbi:hypothetical protein FSARC_1383 [Fusarium sarcochroum]|uniref:Uncharacterized protein n=1 Tax=Fusarium sarcochroum TaxID=1208366 RepID=A0A8H4U8U3_9HYPO|nr:hypothetical protein FSARC_1383 [Fusarium sarcochroum]